ncbi:MAG: DUF1385 domain-containing protein [Oscillospiraceae bacterium]|jgi:uncharacterized protein YqhQ|nr:DUF1385 domain-containing protein [Oscillospiraceae bacterium]MCI9392422.1 DUF1385 domain-containing protein [Oscillospiraceae bacterium]
MSDKQSCAFRTTIGGQALIEGILMRGPEKQAIVVRGPEGLVIKEEELRLIKDRYPILGLPLIRGSVTFLDSMVKGVKALMFSADYFPEEEAGAEEPSKFEKWLDEKLGNEKMEKLVIALSVVMAVCFSVGLFMLLPTFLASFVEKVTDSVLARNLADAALRVALFMSYMIAVSRMKDIRRVFSYHGAEHKTIFCYEKRLELTVENVRAQPKHHPRCGTSFMLVVIIVAILVNTVVFALFPVDNVFLRMAVQLLLLPLVVGITYEFNRYVGGHDNPVTNFLARPGLWMQNFTTFEPDDAMIEVAIEAMRRVIPQEEGKDSW